MRTTVTLDPDVADMLHRFMERRGVAFRVAINENLRRALGPASRSSTETPVFSMGEPATDLTKALEIAGRLENEETLRKLSLRQ